MLYTIADTKEYDGLINTSEEVLFLLQSAPVWTSLTACIEIVKQDSKKTIYGILADESYLMEDAMPTHLNRDLYPSVLNIAAPLIPLGHNYTPTKYLMDKCKMVVLSKHQTLIGIVVSISKQTVHFLHMTGSYDMLMQIMPTQEYQDFVKSHERIATKKKNAVLKRLNSTRWNNGHNQTD
jgi:hypothetical protein